MIPLGSIVNTVLGSQAPAASAALVAPPAIRNVRTKPAPAALAFRKSRRLTSLVMAQTSCAARLIARLIRMYVAHRQRLPDIPSTICWSVGCGFFASNDAACMI